jgi:hypothetical protein
MSAYHLPRQRECSGGALVDPLGHGRIFWRMLVLAIWIALYYPFCCEYFDGSFGRMSMDDSKLPAPCSVMNGREDESCWKNGNDRASPETLDRRRLALVAASFLVAILAPVPPAGAASSITLEVDATGGLPGFHRGELRRYLVLHIAGSGLDGWRFEPAADAQSRYMDVQTEPVRRRRSTQLWTARYG